MYLVWVYANLMQMYAGATGVADGANALQQYFDAMAAGNFSAPNAAAAAVSPDLQQAARPAAKSKDLLFSSERATNTLTRRVTEIYADHEDIATQSGQIMEAIAQTAATTEELSASAQEMAASSAQVAEFAAAVAARSHDGMDLMQQVAAEMGTLVDGSVRTAEANEALHRDFVRIAEIVALINEVAGQTNLLALNAAIEAARAGEHGRGFAVVAEEVRRLSDRTKSAAKEISDTISRQARNINETAQVADASAVTARKAASMVATSETTFNEIAAASSHTRDQVAEIATVAHQQAQAVTEIAGKMQAAQSGISAAGGALEAASLAVYTVSVQLEHQRQDLSSYATPRGDADTIALAITDHLLWRHRVHAMLAGHLRLTAAEVGSSETCRLGQWYHLAADKYGALPAFQAIAMPHAEVHRLAQSAVDSFNRGQAQAAREAMQSLDRAADQVVQALEALGRST